MQKTWPQKMSWHCSVLDTRPHALGGNLGQITAGCHAANDGGHARYPGGVELDDVLRYTGIHDRRGPQRSGLFGAVPADGAILLPENEHARCPVHSIKWLISLWKPATSRGRTSNRKATPSTTSRLTVSTSSISPLPSTRPSASSCRSSNGRRKSTRAKRPPTSTSC